jgi:putative acetyltransferase
MEIRKLENNDIVEVVQLWYETSTQAHDFISPDYWEGNKDAMARVYLPNSETYVVIEAGNVIGFIAMADNYLAAIFVKDNMQGNGVGKNLLNYIKERRETIQLKVYKKNSNSINFYKSQGFKLLSENMEEITNEIELLMEWSK